MSTAEIRLHSVVYAFNSFALNYFSLISELKTGSKLFVAKLMTNVHKTTHT